MSYDSSQADTTADILKLWRARERLSQAEAAAVLRVSVRTLQGWESGRPMPYPDLLQAALTGSIRTADPFLLAQSEFPRQLAGFVDFIGAADLDAALRKVTCKLEQLLPSTRVLYGDRYYFHEQFLRFTEGTAPFHLDISDSVAVRAARLIADINRVKVSLSEKGASRLRRMIIGGLKAGCDIRQLEHELRCATHFARRGFKVTHADLEGLGNFDLLIDGPSGPVELECKTVAEDTGAPIKIEMIAQLFDAFVRCVSKLRRVSVTNLECFRFFLESAETTAPIWFRNSVMRFSQERLTNLTGTTSRLPSLRSLSGRHCSRRAKSSSLSLRARLIRILMPDTHARSRLSTVLRSVCLFDFISRQNWAAGQLTLSKRPRTNVQVKIPPWCGFTSSGPRRTTSSR